MGSEPINPNVPGQEPELHLLLSNQTLDEPLWKSLFRGLDEFFFPKKLPPLKLESKPEPVKDIWGFYNYKKNRSARFDRRSRSDCGNHRPRITIVVKQSRSAAVAAKSVVTLVDPSDLPVLKPSKTQVGGGGGGGDRDVLQASKGKLPKFSMQQITPPVVVVRNEHPKLAVEPTIVIPPQVQLASNNMPNLGDPMAHAVLPSNGTGAGGGIGSGSGGGVGSGKGPASVPVKAAALAAASSTWVAAQALHARCILPEPEFSEEARKAKYQGVCTARPHCRNGRPAQQHPRAEQPGHGTRRKSDRSGEELEVRAGDERRPSGSRRDRSRSRLPPVLRRPGLRSGRSSGCFRFCLSSQHREVSAVV